NSAWGIDVGVTSLKAIKLRRDGAGVMVEAFDVVDHDHFLTEPDIDRDETIRHTLQKFLERNALKRESVFVGVPGSSTFARFVKLPPVDPKQIPQIVRFEAIQQIPFPLEQVNWDYQTFTSADSPEVEVGIFAMKKELVAQVMGNFQSNAMTVAGVQMSPLAVYNAIKYDELAEDKGTILLDIGAEHTDLVFIDSGRVWLRTINIGGNNFTDSLSKSFKVSFAKAEQLKRSAATSKYAKQIFQAMRPVFADLVAEIQRSKGFYDSSHRDSKLDRIIGMGNPFKLPNLQKYIQQELKMEVVRLDTFKKIQVDSKLAAGLNEHILAMAGATGLALQGLDFAPIDTNLLPMEIARQMLWRQKQLWFAGAAALVLAGVGVSAFLPYKEGVAFAASQQTPEAQEHQRVLDEYAGIAAKYNAIPNQYDANRKQIETLLNQSSDRKVWPAILQDLSAALPQAKPGNEKLQKLLILKSITSVYTSDILKATVDTAAAAPAASGGGMPGGMPGGAPPGWGGGAPPGWGGGMPGSMGPGGGGTSVRLSTPAAGANGEARGFVLVIKGYTPYRGGHGGAETGGGRDLVRNYFLDLLARAPEKAPKENAKAYYFLSDPGTSAGYTGSVLSTKAGAGGAAVVGPWSTGGKGPFWDAFGPELLGIKSAPGETSGAVGGGGAPPAWGGGAPPGWGGGGMPGVMGGGGNNTELAAAANQPIDPDTKQVMDGYFIFTMPLRVVLRSPAAP
ncbi:MAG: type IV pilus assembly protein PilM, partial [Phycisphaerae bacterium]